MPRCSLCWHSCDGKIIVQPDNLYIFYKDSVLCPKCFKAWATDDELTLRAILRMKFTPQSGVMVAHKAHNLEVGKLESSDCDSSPNPQIVESTVTKDNITRVAWVIPPGTNVQKKEVSS